MEGGSALFERGAKALEFFFCRPDPATGRLRPPEGVPA